MKTLLSLTISLIIFVCALSSQQAHAQWWPMGSARGYGHDLYAPKRPAANPGLVLLLHGCLQTSKQVMTQTHFAAEAERKGFYILIPQQSSMNNAMSCWNWFERDQQTRQLTGDSEYIMKTLEKVIRQKNIDRNKVFIAGFSSGAAMASNIASCFGDIFKGALIHSGLEFGAATSMGEAFTVMRSGPSRNVEQSADLAYRCMKTHTSMIPVIVAHGSSDNVVYPVNFQRVVNQFQLLNQAIAREIGGQGQITDVKKTRIRGPRLSADVVDESIDGQVMIKAIFVDQMSHAWSGGDSSVQYSEPNGPSVTQVFSEFFFPAP